MRKREKIVATSYERDDYLVVEFKGCASIPMLPGDSIQTTYEVTIDQSEEQDVSVKTLTFCPPSKEALDLSGEAR